MHILVINCGSSSVKYQVIDPQQPSALREGNIQNVGTSLTIDDALAQTLAAIDDIAIDAVGHRVVHGGDEFHDAVVIDDTVITAIERWSSLAPLHNPYNLAGIRAARALLGQIPHVAVFDTAFHARLPRRAATYAIDTELAQQHSIRRYGFHGTSHQYVANEAARFLKRPLSGLRMVSLHLGNGASACAVEMGHSTETSMGMTPLEGLVMGSRSGDIDPGVVLHLQRELGLDAQGMDELLNRRSGLKGLSGLSNDWREIEAAAEQGDDRARLAIAVFVHRIRKYIGAYAAAMGGLDAIVITGGIGENSASLRNRVLHRLHFLGVYLDDDLNQDAKVTHDAPVAAINESHSAVKLLVAKTNEELMIARQVNSLVAESAPETLGGIPIAVSARHIHLDRDTFAALFGADAEPTPYRDLSQPGQYACEERVNLIGPRNRINNVRLLGPLRSKNQVEISRTDEFFLGVDAPVRDSGRTKDSAPITLEGPAGTVHLPEGLICARRHIHMHTDDAKRFGVKNGDEVEVAITGGPRDLVFGDVLVRVSPGYRLEMHIDTDEANAAELLGPTDGQIVYTGVTQATACLKSRHTEV